MVTKISPTKSRKAADLEAAAECNYFRLNHWNRDFHYDLMLASTDQELSLVVLHGTRALESYLLW